MVEGNKRTSYNETIKKGNNKKRRHNMNKSAEKRREEGREGGSTWQGENLNSFLIALTSGLLEAQKGYGAKLV